MHSPEDVRLTCVDLAERLAAMDDRQERADAFEAELDGLPAEVRYVIDLMIQKEVDHKTYVNDLLRDKPGFSTERMKPHDYSKDSLFCFVMSLRFDCDTRTDAMLKLVADEFQRHYTLEAHHPEYELVHNEECSTLDILEMAIDRLSRNVQRNDGDLNMAQIQYQPQFPLGDNDTKQKMYLGFVAKYSDFVQAAYIPIID